jgi:hypothetical protein
LQGALKGVRGIEGQKGFSPVEPLVAFMVLAGHGLRRTGGQEGWFERWRADAQHLPRLNVRVPPAGDGAAPYEPVYPLRVSASRG